MSAPRARPEASSPQALEHEYLRCLLAPDGRRARRVIEDALTAGVPASTLYIDVIAPAMHEIGRLWETAQIGVAQEHLATQITQAVIAPLGVHLHAAEAVGTDRVAIVSATAGELHALGVRMVADFLDAQGWTVLAVGADAPAHELAGLAQARDADLVALSTALPGHLLSVTRTCQLLRRLSRPPYIVVGGSAYGADRDRAMAVGADAMADDPQALLDLLAQRFAGHAAP